jgi:uncharacterized protein YxjI
VNLRKKIETEIQNTMDGYSRRIEQVENRISELEDKMEINQSNNSRAVKVICKNSLTPSKDNT